MSFIASCKFNELRLWPAPQLGIRLVDFQYDFLGCEGTIVQLITQFSLCSDSYTVLLQCWSCCSESEKRLNLTSVTVFKVNCQTTIDNQIKSSFTCLKCRDPNANLECISKGFVHVPSFFNPEVGHLNIISRIEEKYINEEIHVSHNKDELQYSLLGYTIYNGLHFSMKIKLQDGWYAYDGIERPKLKHIDSNSRMLGRINCIIYVLSNYINSK